MKNPIYNDYIISIRSLKVTIGFLAGFLISGKIGLAVGSLVFACISLLSFPFDYGKRDRELEKMFDDWEE